MRYGILTYPAISNNNTIQQLTNKVLNSILTRIPSSLFEFNDNVYILDNKTTKTIGSVKGFDKQDTGAFLATINKRPLGIEEKILYSQIQNNSYTINKDMNGYSLFLYDKENDLDMYTHEQRRVIDIECEFRVNTENDQYAIYEYLKSVFEFKGVEVLNKVKVDIKMPDPISYVLRELYMDNSINDYKERETNFISLLNTKTIDREFDIHSRWLKKSNKVAGYNMDRVFNEIFISFPEEPNLDDPEMKDEVTDYYKVTFPISFSYNLPSNYYLRIPEGIIKRFSKNTTVYNGSRQLIDGTADSFNDYRFRKIKFYNKTISDYYELPIDVTDNFYKVWRFELFPTQSTEMFNIKDFLRPKEEGLLLSLLNEYGKSKSLGLDPWYRIRLFKAKLEVEEGGLLFMMDDDLNVIMNGCDLKCGYSLMITMRKDILDSLQGRYK